MTHQEELTLILKGKGIGPESSKSLKCEDIERVKYLLRQPDASITTKATLLTALLTLSPTDIELEFIEELKASPSLYLPIELVPFIENGTDNFQKTINNIIQHNHLSFDEAETAVSHLFDSTPDFQKGAFLEAERLKRETYEENSAFLKVLKSQVPTHKANIPLLIDLGDSYDGCSRHNNLNLFVAPILASLGYPCLVHSVDEVAPKEGITHHQVLKAAKKNPAKSIAETIANLEDNTLAWGHLDQSVYHKELYALKTVRKEMVKRPFLATFEKMLQPIIGKKNYLITQYTHKHYKAEVAKLVQSFCIFDKALHIKGMEGTCMINPKIPSECMLITPYTMEDITIYGNDYGFTYSLPRKENITAEDTLSMGLRILEGEKGEERSFLEFQCASILHYLFKIDFNEALHKTQQTIDNKDALSFWQRY